MRVEGVGRCFAGAEEGGAGVGKVAARGVVEGDVNAGSCELPAGAATGKSCKNDRPSPV